MEIRSKEYAVRAEAAEPAPEDLQLINERFALAPLQPEEIYVRRLALCNDRYDRTGERFPPYYLERFAATLPGKPLLAHHDRRQFPLGRFFRAEVTQEPEPPAGEKHTGLPARTTWLYCRVYLVRTPGNEEIRRQIDAGIYSHVSIGFRWADLTCDLCGKSYFRSDCPHVIGQEYDGRPCTATYGGDPARVEAVEASLVYLGAQYGAVITKSSDRRAEKAVLAGRAWPEPPPEAEVALAADGRLYREDLRREIARLARCIGAEREGAALLEGIGDAPASRLKELLAEYQGRFDRIFPSLRLPAESAPERPGDPFRMTP